MITVDNITDMDIVMLRNLALFTGDHELADLCHEALPADLHWRTIVAHELGPAQEAPTHVRVAARARCAEILNARAKEQQ